MKREQLKALGLTDEQIERVMTENGNDVNKVKADLSSVQAQLATAQSELNATKQELSTAKAQNGSAAEVQKQLTELQAKYDKETRELQEKLTAKDYDAAISTAIAGADKGKGLKFSSKSAERAFCAALKQKALKLENGALQGFDDFLKEQREADPDAFVAQSTKPQPRFTGGSGSSNPAPQEPDNVKLAKELGRRKAAASQASGDVFSMYAGGPKPQPAPQT